jgi:hypothetical protein
MLGHSSIALTLTTYSHVVPALHPEVATHMDKLFSAPAEQLATLVDAHVDAFHAGEVPGQHGTV